MDNDDTGVLDQMILHQQRYADEGNDAKHHSDSVESSTLYCYYHYCFRDIDDDDNVVVEVVVMRSLVVSNYGLRNHKLQLVVVLQE